MTTNSNNMEKKLKKSDLKKVFWRSCTLDSAWNYERQQHLMYCYAMIPVIKRLYGDDKEETAAALKRHLEFMACTPHMVTLLLGISSAMEEQNANDENFDASSISAVKTSLMGPIAGLGDSFFWGTLLTIAVGIGVSFAKQGSILGPIIFLLIINIPGFLSRYYCLKFGYASGVKFFTDVSKSNIVQQVTKYASILGLLVIGSMVASMVSVPITLNVGVGEIVEPLQGYLDQIMPCLLPALTFIFMYWLLGKKVKTTRILVCLLVFCCVVSFFGIM